MHFSPLSGTTGASEYLDALGAGVMIAVARKPVYANPALAAIFGYADPAEIVALQDYFKLISDADRSRVAGYAKTRQIGKDGPQAYEFEGVRRDGSIINVVNQPRLIEWQGQSAVLATVVDVTEKKRVEEENLKHLANLDFLLNTQTDLITQFDQDGKILFANKAYADFIGVPYDSIIGSSIFEHVVEEDIAALKATFQSLTLENPQLSNQNKNISKAGEVRVFEWINLGQFDDQGTLLVVQSVGRDITELIEKEEALRQRTVSLQTRTSEMVKLVRENMRAKEKAEASEKVKSEFLASMSHEIRTPMSSVIGFADLLLDDQLHQDSREKVLRIKDASTALLHLINEILDLSKLEAGKMEVENIDFHLPTLLTEVRNLFTEKRETDAGKSLPIFVHMPDGVPSSVRMDPSRLRQILINLVGNAVKFTETGSVEVTVTLAESTEAAPLERPRLRFEVRDTGIGMSSETITKLFNDFTQADASTSRRFEGTGLGLSICKRLVELMGGEISVESELGVGSLFVFALPFEKSRTEVHGRTRSQEVEEFEAVRPLNILVAEDNRMNQHIIRATMGKYGHAIDIAENGSEVIDKFKIGNFDLILMDVRMPYLSGTEATRIIRKLKPDGAKIPIIALTADAMDESKQECRAAGMDLVVTKPIDRSLLLRSVNEVLSEEIHRPVVEPCSLDSREYKASVSTEMSANLTHAADLEDVLQGLNSVLESVDL